MSELEDFSLFYEEMPFKPSKAVGRTRKMSKAKATESAPKKRYSKTRGEHIKDIVIAVLIAGIVAFVGGVQFANGQNDRVNNAVT